MDQVTSMSSQIFGILKRKLKEINTTTKNGRRGKQKHGRSSPSSHTHTLGNNLLRLVCFVSPGAKIENEQTNEQERERAKDRKKLGITSQSDYFFFIIIKNL